MATWGFIQNVVNEKIPIDSDGLWIKQLRNFLWD